MGLFSQLQERLLVKPVADRILKTLTPPLNAGNTDAGVTSNVGLQTFSVPIGFNNAMANYNKRMVSTGSVDWPVLRSLSVNHETTRAAINVRKREIIQLGYEVVDVDDDANAESNKADREKAREEITNLGGQGVRFRELLDKMIEDTLVLDACVLYKQRTRDGKLLRVIPIDGATIKLRVDEAGLTPLAPEIAYEQWIRGEKTANLTTDEIIYEMMNPRTDNPYGLSPLESLILTLDSSMRAMLYNLSYLSDNSVPQGFINVPDDWKIQQIKDYTEYLHALISGPKAQAKIYPIPAKAKYIPTSKPNDFAFKDFFDYLDRRICMLFDVTPQELGLSLQQYKENAEGQEKIQIRKGIKPLANFLQEIFTDILRDELGYPSYAFKFTGLDTRFTPEDAKLLIPLGVLNIDEVRNDQGLKKLGAPNIIITPGGGITPVDQIEEHADAELKGKIQATQPPKENLATQGVNPEQQNPKNKQKAAVSQPLEKLQRNKTLDRLEKAANYKTMHGKIKRAIAKQIAPFTSEAVVEKVSHVSKADDVSEADIEDVMPTFRIEGFDSYLKWAAEQGGQHAYDALNINSSFTLTNPKFAQMLGDRENYLIDSVDSTTKDWIVSQLSQGHAQGMTNAEIASNIHDQMDGISLARANTITNTETNNATQTAELDTYREQGVTKKVWVLSEDIDDECGENADQGAIDVEDDFSTGDAAPPAHPNCRCFLQADIESVKMAKGWITINGAHVLIDNEGSPEGAGPGISESFGGRGEGKPLFSRMTEPDQLKATEQGKKPLTFLPDVEEKGYQSETLPSIPLHSKMFHLENGKVAQIEDFPMKVWFQPQNRGAAQELLNVYHGINNKLASVKIGDPQSSIPPISAAEHTQIGHLLGYSPSEISSFLGRINAKMVKGWVTINGAHVLIADGGDGNSNGGGEAHSTGSVPMPQATPKIGTTSLNSSPQELINHFKDQALMQINHSSDVNMPSNIEALIRQVDISSAKTPIDAANAILKALPANAINIPDVSSAILNWGKQMQQVYDLSVKSNQ